MAPKPKSSSRPHSVCVSRAASPATVSLVSTLPISDPEPSGNNKAYIPLCFCLISFAVMICVN
jgi:hypothetical protein